MTARKTTFKEVVECHPFPLRSTPQVISTAIPQVISNGIPKVIPNVISRAVTLKVRLGTAIQMITFEEVQ